MKNQYVERNILIFFTLSFDRDHTVLSHCVDWAEEFNKHTGKIIVVCTRASDRTPRKDIDVIELGGGGINARLHALFRLYSLVPFLLRNRRRISVFHHMTTYPLALIGLLIRIFKIPQALWYSHSKGSLHLRIGMFFVNLIFSPTIRSFPYKSKKLKAMNHGINFRPVKNETNGREINSIVCVGRVVPIKQLEILMKAIEKLSPVEFGVVLIGPLDDPKYYMEIANLANKFQINLVTLGELEKSAMIDEFMKFDYVFSGTPKSVDKAPLEAAGSGLVILTLNHELQVVSGLDHWFSNKFKIPLEELDITEQLRLYLSQGITSDERVDLARTVRSRNSLELLVGKITAMLNEVYR